MTELDMDAQLRDVAERAVDRGYPRIMCNCADVLALLDRLAAAEAAAAHWKAHAEEAGEGFARVCRDYARTAATVSRVGALANEWEAQTDAIAITYQDADRRRMVTSGQRRNIADLRAALDQGDEATT